jgi:glycine cleavage system H protein
LGDIVNIELPAVGSTVQAGEPFGSVDSVKAVSDIISPVSGEVLEVNEDLPVSPELINQEPYAGGWMIIVKLSDPSELDALMTSEEYEQYIQPE